jgi:ABC-type phosphate/phosphonate transport system substrate-binding protein
MPEMDVSLKSRIKELLLDLKHSTRGQEILQQARLSAFNPVSNRDYDSHRTIIDAVNAR